MLNKKLYIISGIYNNKPFLDYTWSKETKESTILKEYSPVLHYEGFSSIKVIKVQEATHKEDLKEAISRFLLKPLSK